MDPQQQQQQFSDPGPQPLEAAPEQLQKKVGRGLVTEDMLREYMSLEQTIQQQASVATLYRAKKAELDNLARQVAAGEDQLKQLTQIAEKEYADVVNVQQPSVQAMLQQQGQNLQAVLSKEQHEYMQALNKKEMCEMEVAGLKSKVSQLEASMEQYKQAYVTVESAYDRQDAILSDMFDGEYGSEQEQFLEGELDETMTKRYRIHLADYNWRYARKFLYNAVCQMAVGLRRWIDLTKIPYNQQMHQLRSQVVHEARANFVAASQNFAACQNILSTIDFPYCKPQEIVTLNTAIQHIFTDMLTNHRYQHAFQCYNSVHLRSAALLQWFDKVITEVIAGDLASINQVAKEKSRALRHERVTLIAAKMKELLNVEVDLQDMLSKMDEFGDDFALDDVNVNPTNEAAAFAPPPEAQGGEALDRQVEAAKHQGGQDDPESEFAKSEGGNPVLGAAVADAALQSIKKPEAEPPRRPLHEIAQAPSNDVVFGSADKMISEFGSVQSTYEQRESSDKAQMENSLQRKLAERKARKARGQ